MSDQDYALATHKVADPGHQHDTAKGAAIGAAAAIVVPGIGPIVGKYYMYSCITHGM